MIPLHRLNGSKFFVNPHLIEKAEESPDTVLTLVGASNKYIVKESISDIIDKIVLYRKRISNYFEGEIDTEVLDT